MRSIITAVYLREKTSFETWVWCSARISGPKDGISVRSHLPAVQNFIEKSAASIQLVASLLTNS